MAVHEVASSKRQSILKHLPVDTIDLCNRIFGVSQPKDDQLEVVARIGEHRDTILIAGCGWGKTLVYYLPLVLWRDKTVVIITPLTALGDEQSQRLIDKNITSVNLKGTSNTSVSELIQGQYQAVFMSPEILFESGHYMNLWDNEGWKDRLLAIIIDEAHCVSNWKTFRNSYLSIKELQYKVRDTTCFIALSATMPATILADVKHGLAFRDVQEINVGNDRANIKYIVRTMLSAKEKKAC